MKSLFWNRVQNRLRAGWRLAVFTLSFYVLNIVLVTVGSIAFLGPVLQQAQADLAGADPLELAGRLALLPEVLFLGGVAWLIAVVASVWFCGRALDRRPFRAFGFHIDRGWWLDFAFGLALGMLLMAGIFAAEYAAGWVTIAGTFQTGETGQQFVTALLLPLALFFCVGIYEELLSRGYLLRNLADGLHLPHVSPQAAVLMAWVLSSILFGLLHADNPNATTVSTVNLMAAGLFLGLGYVLTGELALPIGLHMTWNFFQGNVFGFPVSGTVLSPATVVAIRQGGPEASTGGAFGPEAGLVGLAAMLAGALLIAGWVRVTRGRLALLGDLAQYEAPVVQSGGGPVPHR